MSCADCGRYVTPNYEGKRCPHCGGDNVYEPMPKEYTEVER